MGILNIALKLVVKMANNRFVICPLSSKVSNRLFELRHLRKKMKINEKI